MPATPEPTTRRAPSIRRRLLLFAALILIPVMTGAVVSGGMLLHATSRSDALGAEVVQESRASVALLQALQAARLAGSGYMEEGERDELADFDRASGAVAEALRATAVFDESLERAALRGAQRQWRAAANQLRRTQAGFGKGPLGEEDPEDVFEAHVNEAIGVVERLVAHSQDEADAELAAARRAARWQALGAMLALFVSLATAVALAGRMAAALPRPLEQLTRAVRALGAGDLDQRIPLAPSAELRELGETFNRMAAALREQHEQLERQAFTDPLTGVPNRALFERRARAALERGRGTVGVLMLDLDDFKLINDGLGHLSGDQLIRLAAERISAAARPSDTVARLGGDEFAVLLEDLRGLDDALAAAERLRRRFDAPFDLDGSQVVVSASIGVALAQGSLDPVELLRRADLAMYRVKERGKDGTMFFDPQMEDRAVGRLDAVNALRAALDRGELVAHFQPLVELGSGDVVSAEALLRWERPGHGLVAPGDFIPLAEETGLIQPIGAWILEEACTQARRWRADGHARVDVSVNVSARQLLDPEFERMVAQTLRTTGLDPAALVLEVTESSVMQNAELTIPKLERIAATGVRLWLDDFGEGYSSLSHIRRLPIAGLKIARPFVRELGDRGGDHRLVHGIIELARRLDLTLVAEGIELRAQEEALRSFGCRIGQGFLFSRPVPASAFRALLADSVRDPVT